MNDSYTKNMSTSYKKGQLFTMRETKCIETDRKIMVNIKELQGMLSIGQQSAAAVGEAAGAVVRVGRRKLYRVDKIEAYIASITEVGA